MFIYINYARMPTWVAKGWKLTVVRKSAGNGVENTGLVLEVWTDRFGPNIALYLWTSIKVATLKDKVLIAIKV